MKRFLWALAALPSSFSPINSSRRSGSSQKRHWFVFTALSLLLLATGLDHFGSAYKLPNACLAIFFIAGFLGEIILRSKRNSKRYTLKAQTPQE